MAPCSITAAPLPSFRSHTARDEAGIREVIHTRYYTARDGAKIHYDFMDCNRRARRTLVLLHGFAADSHHWLSMLENNPGLLWDYKVVFITLRGHGSGDRYSQLGNLKAQEYYPAIAADIEGILNKERISSAVFVGHSMGGEISRFFYTGHPHRVEAMILISSFCRFPLEANPLLRMLKVDSALVGAARAMLKVPGLTRLLEWYKNTVITRTLTRRVRIFVRRISNSILFVDVSEEKFERHLLPMAISTSFEAYLLGLDAMGTVFNGKSKLPVRVPTMIVHGNGDKLVWGIEAEMLQEQIPGADIYFCEGRHFPHYDPVHFPRLMNGFLDSLDSRREGTVESAC